MRMAELGTGRETGSHPAQHGGWHGAGEDGGTHGSSGCAQQGTKPPQWLGGQFLRVGAHWFFSPSFDLLRFHGKTTRCSRQIALLASALTTGPGEAARRGRAQREGLREPPPRSAAPVRRPPDGKCLPHLHPSSFRHDAPRDERAGRASRRTPGKGSPGDSRSATGPRGAGARARPPFGGEATGPRRPVPGRRAPSPPDSWEPGGPGTPAARPRRRPRHLHPLRGRRPRSPLRPRPADGPGAGA